MPDHSDYSQTVLFNCNLCEVNGPGALQDYIEILLYTITPTSPKWSHLVCKVRTRCQDVSKRRKARIAEDRKKDENSPTAGNDLPVERSCFHIHSGDILGGVIAMVREF